MHGQIDFKKLTEKLHQQLPLLAEQYRVKSLGVFGSYVRQEQSPDSDLDLLVTFDELPSLLKFIELENYLSDILGIKVDLCNYRHRPFDFGLSVRQLCFVD